MIPRPFSKVHLRWAKLIYVPHDADDAAMKSYYNQMQESLERARQDAVAALGEGAS
jgi:lysophospholipid acyltransferase (LPLAT)-like uncharacterized protein